MSLFPIVQPCVTFHLCSAGPTFVRCMLMPFYMGCQINICTIDTYTHIYIRIYIYIYIYIYTEDFPALHDKCGACSSSPQYYVWVIIIETNGAETARLQEKLYLSNHFKLFSSDNLHSHTVTKNGRTWYVSFQLRWLEQFLCFSYSSVLSGDICHFCILFPEQPSRGEELCCSNRS